MRVHGQAHLTRTGHARVLLAGQFPVRCGAIITRTWGGGYGVVHGHDCVFDCEPHRKEIEN